jgi:small-conductance mechanosensitive channel
MSPGTVVVQTDPPALDVRAIPEKPGGVAEAAGVLWYAIVGTPMFVLLNLQLSYSLTPVACSGGSTLVMHLLTAILLALVIVAGVGAAVRLRRDWIEDAVLSRPSFMAMIGILESVLFSMVIIAQWLPHAYLSPCQ